MIVNQELVKMVGSNTLFKGVSKDLIKSFIKPKNYYGVKEGTIIYSKGDESTNIYLIVEGEVKIKCCDRNKVEYRFITDFFGENEILSKSERTSYAVANNDCILYSIKAEELKSLSHLQKTIASNLTQKKTENIYEEATESAYENNLANTDYNNYDNASESNPDEVHNNMDNTENLNEGDSETQEDAFNEDDELVN